MSATSIPPPGPPRGMDGSLRGLRVGGALRHILVVDDSPTVRAVVGEMLARLGHKDPDVAFADSPDEAYAAFEASRPGVVLLDLELGLDGGAGAGAELARRMLAHEPKTPRPASSS